MHLVPHRKHLYKRDNCLNMNLYYKRNIVREMEKAVVHVKTVYRKDLQMLFQYSFYVTNTCILLTGKYTYQTSGPDTLWFLFFVLMQCTIYHFKLSTFLCATQRMYRRGNPKTTTMQYNRFEIKYHHMHTKFL